MAIKPAGRFSVMTLSTLGESGALEVGVTGHAERVDSADKTDLPRSKGFLVTNKTNKHYLSLNMH